MEASINLGITRRKFSGDNKPVLAGIQSATNLHFSQANLPISTMMRSKVDSRNKSATGAPKSQSSPHNWTEWDKSQIKVDEELPSIVDKHTPEHLREFLSKVVNFNGNNLDPQLRKLCLVCRAVLERPQLLMIFEETLEFGSGIESNMRMLFDLLEDTTIMVITKTNTHLHLYKKVLLMDAGYLFQGGNLEQLLQSEQSFMYKYLQETDQRTLSAQLNRFGIKEKSRSQSHNLKIAGLNSVDIKDPNKAFGLSFGAKSQTENLADEPSQKGESVVPSHHQSDRNIARLESIGARMRNMSSHQPETEHFESQQAPWRQPSLFTNHSSGSANAPFKLQQALREAFQLKPIAIAEQSPSTNNDFKQKRSLQSISAFAAPNKSEVWNKIPTISSQGVLEKEPSKHELTLGDRPSSQVDPDLNITDGAHLSTKGAFDILASSSPNPRMIQSLTAVGSNYRPSQQPLPSLAHLKVAVSPTGAESEGRLSPPSETVVVETQVVRAVKVFPETKVKSQIRSNSGSEKTPRDSAVPNGSAAAQDSTKRTANSPPKGTEQPKLYLLEEEYHITAKRTLIVSA